MVREGDEGGHSGERWMGNSLRCNKKRPGNQKRVLTLRPRERESMEQEGEVPGMMGAGKRASHWMAGSVPRATCRGLQ